MELTDPRVLCLGTHHKTGTVWLQRVFRTISRALSIPCSYIFNKSADQLIPADGRVILFSSSCRFRTDLLSRADARFLHVIRDPRDVLLSGMRYHQVCGEFGEKLVHMKRDDLGGLSYQEHIRSLPDDEAKLLFEMEERHADTLREMRAWDYARANNIEMRYETLMQDHETTAFKKVLRAMGFDGKELTRAAKIFWRKSLFGGMAEEGAHDARVQTHVTSGKIAQWRTKLPRRIAEIYAERHGQDLVALGYEPHPTHWLKELHHAA